jgi:lipid A 3-O-deacylase
MIAGTRNAARKRRKWMKRTGMGIIGRLAAGIATTAALALPAGAGTKSYDLNQLLYQPHPFASGGASGAYAAPPPAVPYYTPYTPPPPPMAAPVPAMQIRQPARVPMPGVSPAPARTAASPTVTQRRPPVMAQPTGQAAALHDRGGGWRNIFSEMRVGVLAHDQGPFSSSEEDGIDINLEVLFKSPSWLEWAWSPRPHLGLNANTSGDTSQIYFGVTWEWSFWGNWFAGFSWGGSVHDGEKQTNRTDKKELGCHLLFREAVEGGYRFGGKHAVSIYLDHISNANICDKNEGLENWGLRYGYKF